MNFDRYFLTARLAPAIIGSIPFFVLYLFFLGSVLASLFHSLAAVTWVGGVSTMAAFIILLASVGRSISKDIFERRWFKSDETRMPTTDFLMHRNSEYSAPFKRDLREKIRADFNIELHTELAEAEDESGARKRIAEAVVLIRQQMKDGRLLLQHNIEYGFFRNLVGCSVVAEVVLLANILVFTLVSPNHVALYTSITLLVLYAIPIAFAKPLMRVHGKRYARVLIQEYLAA